MATLIAIEAGYDNVKVREPGEEFEWPDTINTTVGGETMAVKNPLPPWAKLKKVSKADAGLE
jgi:hypothetical protein